MGPLVHAIGARSRLPIVFHGEKKWRREAEARDALNLDMHTTCAWGPVWVSGCMVMYDWEFSRHGCPACEFGVVEFFPSCPFHFHHLFHWFRTTCSDLTTGCSFHSSEEPPQRDVFFFLFGCLFMDIIIIWHMLVQAAGMFRHDRWGHDGIHSLVRHSQKEIGEVGRSLQKVL